jgi:O-antigen ligase
VRRSLPATLAALTVLAVCVPTGGGEISGAVTITPADVISALLVAVVSLRVLAGDRPPRSRVWLAMAVAVLAFGVATVTSADPAASLSGFVRYLQLFVLVPAAVALAVRRRQDALLVCGAVLAAAVFEGAVGTWQYVTGTGASYDGQSVRAVGTFGAQEVMSMALVVAYGLVVAVGLALVVRGQARIALLAVAALLVVPLMLSLSRGAVIATVCAVGAMLLTANPKLALRFGVFGGAAAVALVGIAGPSLGVNSPGQAGTLVAARIATIASAATTPDRSVQDRYDLWHTALDVWRDRPVTGVGLKQFPYFRDAHAPLSLSSGSDVADPQIGFRREPLLSPHNMYLLVLSEQGLAGLIGFGGLLLTLAFMTVNRARLARRTARPQGRLVSIAATGIVAWTLVNFGFGDIGGPSTVLTSVTLGLAVWWVLRPQPTVGRTR